MTNMMKDYYKILGVSELCTDSELKSAYRKLARKCHPDIAGNSDNVVSFFKDINEAYEVLSDKSKRATYDTSRRYYNYSSTNKTSDTCGKRNTSKPDFKNTKQQSNNSDKTKSGFKINWEEVLAKYKEYAKKDNRDNNQHNTGNVSAVKGKNVYTDVEVTIFEAVNGTTKIINMIHTQVCPKCGGRKFINASICHNCSGKGELSEYKKFTIKIPAGIKNGSKIRLSGEGEKGLNGGANGDLYVTVHIKEQLDYSVEGLNVIKKISLAPYEAVLGGNVSIKTPDGNVTVKIAPNTQSGQKIRLSGCGLKNNGKSGDMILTVEIQIPQNLSEKEIDLYKKLKDISSYSVR